jgi:hypothetical protein
VAVTTVTIPTGGQQSAPANQEQQQAPTEPQRPEWCPEKFWQDGKVNSEALAKSYGELERKTSAPKPPADTPAETTPPPTMTIEQAQAAAKSAGLDLKALSKEYLANGGKLSAETQQALTEKGISADVVKTFAAGAEATARELTKGIVELVGSEDNRKAVYDWAQANLTAPEMEAYNAVVEAGNMDAVKLAFMGVLSRYNAANPPEPELLGGTPPSADDAPFASHAEISAAMRDPRYGVDEAYRNKVARRMAKVNFLSVRQV